MAYGYVIGQITVTRPDDYPAYVEKVGPIVAKFGGEFLARAGRQEVYEGEPVGPRTVILRFPSYQAALDWYHSEDYAQAKAMRMAASTSIQTIVEGV